MDLAYRSLIAMFVRRQAKQLAEQMDGVRAAEDLEFVHRARVATRRLRAAFRMSADAFRAKRIKRWRRAMHRITAALGDARDRDVQIDCLCGILGALADKGCFVGIAHVLVQLEHDRERLQRRVVKAFRRLQAEEVLREMRRVSGKILRRLPAVPENLQTPDALAEARRQITARLETLLEHQGSLADPKDCRGHHAMRIAVKRLRYTMEICRPLYSGGLDAWIEAAKRLQTLLGEVHDCDVWQDHLDAFTSTERKRIAAMFGSAGRFSRLQPGIDYLRDNRRRRRQEIFGGLVAFWAELDQRRFPDELRATAAPPAAEAGPSTGPSAGEIQGEDAAVAKERPADGNGSPATDAQDPSRPMADAPAGG